MNLVMTGDGRVHRGARAPPRARPSTASELDAMLEIGEAAIRRIFERAGGRRSLRRAPEPPAAAARRQRQPEEAAPSCAPRSRRSASSSSARPRSAACPRSTRTGRPSRGNAREEGRALRARASGLSAPGGRLGARGRRARRRAGRALGALRRGRTATTRRTTRLPRCARSAGAAHERRRALRRARWPGAARRRARARGRGRRARARSCSAPRGDGRLRLRPAVPVQRARLPAGRARLRRARAATRRRRSATAARALRALARAPRRGCRERPPAHPDASRAWNRRATSATSAIIAHIDHGKSTLADRMLEITGAVAQARHARPAARRHGPRARARHHDQGHAPSRSGTRRTASDYELNLIDTPGPRRLQLRGAEGACRPARARSCWSTRPRASRRRPSPTPTSRSRRTSRSSRSSTRSTCPTRGPTRWPRRSRTSLGIERERRAARVAPRPARACNELLDRIVRARPAAARAIPTRRCAR